MSHEPSLEQRVAILEQTVVELQRGLTAIATHGNWLEKLTGSISDESAFLEALEYGRAFRKRDQSPVESGPSS